MSAIPFQKARNQMSIRNTLLLAATAALVVLAVFAGTAAADGVPTPPGAGTPQLPSVEPATTLLLPRNVRAGTAASIALRVDGAAAAELRADRVACAFRLGQRSLAGTTRVSGSSALCIVRVPRNAAGQSIRGAIRVVLTHMAIERQFAFKVARA